MRAPLLLHARWQSLVLKSWCSPAGYAELWAVGAVGAAHLVSAGSCAVRHHTWGSISPDFAAFLLLQLQQARAGRALCLLDTGRVQQIDALRASELNRLLDADIALHLDERLLL